MKKQRTTKPVHSLRLSAEGVRQLKNLSLQMHRSEANVVEIALDRMYREEIRFGSLTISESVNSYVIGDYKEDK